MGGLPSREASGSIRTLRYGNHEIGLIPLTRQFFNKENPELCQQFIRVRNDPNVRYCHMRAPGYSMDELPPADYSQEDLDALVDTIEESLFDSNEDFLNAGAAPVASFSVAEMHRILQMEGLVDPVDAQLDLCSSAYAKRASSDTTNTENSNCGMTSCGSRRESESELIYPANHTPITTTAAPTAAAVNERELGGDHRTPPEQQFTGSTGDETDVPAAPTPAQNVENTFRCLKAELQSFYRATEKNDAVDYAARAATLSDLFQTVLYRRFKRAVRPLPCAVVFIYVNSREEHDCFNFRGHRINVIGCFGLRTYENENDDTIPVLQIRKGIVKAAGDRTLERVLALAAKSFVDCFTEVVMRELQRRPASVLLRDVGEEARGLLRELPATPLLSAAATLPGSGLPSSEPKYDPVSIAHALFFERVSKYPLLCLGLFNNYPTLKFVFDFSALSISVEEGRTGRKEQMRLCTYQREKDERGLAFLFPGRLLAYTWLWSATQTQPPTVRDSWVQYTLNEYAQSRERRVQQWLETSQAAKVMLGNATTTRLFLQHLDNLHSEIVRARTTSTDDSASWASAQEYSYDTKLYRIFISPLCGPLLTTVKEQKSVEAAGRGGVANTAKKSQPRACAARGGGNDSTGTGDEAAAGRADKDALQSQHMSNNASNKQSADAQKGPCTATGAAASRSSKLKPGAVSSQNPGNPSTLPPSAGSTAGASMCGVTPPYPHPAKLPTAHVGTGNDTRTNDKDTTMPASGASHGAPPPSYAALARGAYPLSGMATFSAQPSAQPVYLPGNCIAVPTTPSGAPWVVPQFCPPSSASLAGLQPPQPQPQPQLSTCNAKAGATTYILQIGSDGKQTLMPVAIASNTSMNGSAGTQTLPSPYQISGMSPPTMIASGFSSQSSLTGPLQGPSQSTQQQQHLYPLASGAGNGGVYYAPASFITPLQSMQPIYPATSAVGMPAVAMPPSVQYSLCPPNAQPGASASTIGSASLTAPQQVPCAESFHGLAGAHNVMPQQQQQPPPSYASQAELYKVATPTSADMESPLQGYKKAVVSQQLQLHEVVSNASDDADLFAHALRLLD